MAKLIVTRPRLGRRWDSSQNLDVLIDGEPAAPIGLGKTIAIELPPGPHQVRARINRVGSQPVALEPGPDETHRLAVGFNVGFHKLITRSKILGSLPFFAIIAWDLFDAHQLLTNLRQPGPVLSQSDWKRAFMIPAGFLMVLIPLAFRFLWPDEFLVVCEVPTPELTDQQIAELLRSHPSRLRITIRQMMIAVALLTLALWGSLENYRFTRASSFRTMARFHAHIEAVFREFERDSKAAAMADYHAAMKRKYEQAAARGVFSVEIDPPEPPWP
jgi:hypothetical protein